MKGWLAIGLLAGLASFQARASEVVKIGLNYPQSGPYFRQGEQELRGAELALEEVNASGGILGKRVEFVIMDEQSNAAVSAQNGTLMVEKHGVKMIFGGSASSTAVAMSTVAAERKVLFFATLAYASEVTGIYGNKHVFRECYDSHAGAHALADELAKLKGKKFFYITARYTWGYSTEKAIREISGTLDLAKHSHAYTPFPRATDQDIADAVAAARKANADVIVVVLFGNDMVRAVQEIHKQGLKSQAQIVVPNITLAAAQGAGPEAMEGVIGAIPWLWQATESSAAGKRFVEKYVSRYKSYPDTAAASAYSILHQYKSAVERAKTFDSAAVIKALEGHEYTLLKDKQVWRSWDHQSVQTVYAVRARKAEDVKKSRFQQDYFEIIGKMSGDKAFIRKSEWEAARKAAGKPIELE